MSKLYRNKSTTIFMLRGIEENDIVDIRARILKQTYALYQTCILCGKTKE